MATTNEHDQKTVEAPNMKLEMTTFKIHMCYACESISGPIQRPKLSLRLEVSTIGPQASMHTYIKLTPER
jgi:hypothetical protein